MDLRWTNVAAYKIAWSYADVSNFICTSKIIVINCKRLINDFANPFCVCTCGIECWILILAYVQ